MKEGVFRALARCKLVQAPNDVEYVMAPHFPLAPMEAESVEEVPRGPGWQYEPKWDGFRCVVFRDDKKIVLQSKAKKQLTRYFPEIVKAIGALKAKHFVVDGEIVIPSGNTFSFDNLLQRIHPAASRIEKLSVQTPALLIIFDLLGYDDKSLIDAPLSSRRKQLEKFANANLRGVEAIRLSPATARLASANGWLKRVGATLDGIIAKRLDAPYAAGSRHEMVKIKNYRTADCVIGGFRYNQGKPVVGSLLLGLYDDDGLLHHVGFTSALSEEEKEPLTARLKKLIAKPGFNGNAPGGPSRWSTARSAKWEPLKPKLVVEISYDHFTGGRFRHGTRIVRWRPDKSPKQCTMRQIKQKKGNLAGLLS